MDSPGPTRFPASAEGLLRTDLDGLGVTLHADGGTLRVWSSRATSMDLVVFDDDDLDWAIDVVPLTRGPGDVWEATSAALRPGTRYAVQADGPRGAGDMFNAATLLLDPYARGLVEGGIDDWRAVAVDGSFDWQGVAKPAVPLDRTVLYEAHLKGLTKRHPDLPGALRGTYAGLAHPAMIDHFHSLGVTSIELLPIHAFTTEPHLRRLGLPNYWGYNTLGFFAPHAPYATEAARHAGPEAVLCEVKTMVRTLHEAGLEVILDVVYNHTSEGEIGGPRTSLRGLDNRAYYRQRDDGQYLDVTGCGNAVDTATDAAARLVLDSLRYWADEVQIDGFRFDLAVTLGRDARNEFTADHPLLRAIVADPVLAGVKRIAEPWDIGMGGWQTGNFGEGWHEWNDRYRDRVRNFWLSDIDYGRRASAPPVGIGGFATRLAGSSNTFSRERGPIASINFVTAHDGFTLRDLVSYDVKHNYGNGEQNRDGADTNRSFNHGAEGRTDDPGILATRRKAMRNLLGTLLLSAGVPMLTAGDEYARTQRGNNNAYCHDSALTWVSWQHENWQRDLFAHAQRLIRLRQANPALRPTRFAQEDRTVPGASQMEWYDERGHTMSGERWTDPRHRTLQYVASSTPEFEEPNRILLIVHGIEVPVEVTLPRIAGVSRYVSVWSSADEHPVDDEAVFAPGDVVDVPGTSMRLFRVE
ncbi:glycogen debranching protein GlgX [Microbacterium sp. zg.Y1090]|uniref:glycogen debranching protein GlgX n=1 Tax=Microbacterium wangruii TaxID=3049073 RepID=UPI00214D410B|nr:MULTISPECIES: glycogen debranching protein GlgX [unclassified Microbacterium]MCR2818900.1 glycogen debranching protein GlgX [Microbacterium sp. zg.Y1090]WIM29737.1 glycogen debranching protein GlgX [Microbacterium sp. zg-Y1090]